MSYIPTRDRFHLGDATQERIAELAEQIEVRAVIAYHADECGSGHGALRCGYSPPVSEVIADLMSLGLLSLPADE